MNKSMKKNIIIFFSVFYLANMIIFIYFIELYSRERFITKFLSTPEEDLGSFYNLYDEKFRKRFSNYIRSSKVRKDYILSMIKNLDFSYRHKWWLLNLIFFDLSQKERSYITTYLMDKYLKETEKYNFKNSTAEEDLKRIGIMIDLSVFLELANKDILIEFCKEIIKNTEEHPNIRASAITHLPADMEDESIINLINSFRSSEHPKLREKAQEYLKRRTEIYEGHLNTTMGVRP